MWLMIQSAQEDGLTLAEMLADLPHDPAAIVGYLFVGAFVAFVWWGHKKSGSDAG